MSTEFAISRGSRPAAAFFFKCQQKNCFALSTISSVPKEIEIKWSSAAAINRMIVDYTPIAERTTRYIRIMSIERDSHKSIE